MSEFTDYLNEVFEKFGTVQARKMFGGYGLYHDGVMFGLIADEQLYLKADTDTAHYFQNKGLEQFTYTKTGKLIKMSYFLAPEEIFEDRDEAAIWAHRSFEVAFRQQRAATKTSTKLKNR